MKMRLNFAGFSWAVSFGALATLASLSMEKASLSRFEIGLHGSAYYFSIALGSIFMTKLIKSMGNITMIVGLLGAAMSVVLFAFARMAASVCLHNRHSTGSCHSRNSCCSRRASRGVACSSVSQEE